MPENPVNPVRGKYREMDQEFKTNQDSGQFGAKLGYMRLFVYGKKRYKFH